MHARLCPTSACALSFWQIFTYLSGEAKPKKRKNNCLISLFMKATIPGTPCSTQNFPVTIQ
jgi:hypothetical protein